MILTLRKTNKDSIKKKKVIVNCLLLWNLVRLAPGKCFVGSSICVTQTESSWSWGSILTVSTKQIPAVNSSHSV